MTGHAHNPPHPQMATLKVCEIDRLFFNRDLIRLSRMAERDSDNRTHERSKDKRFQAKLTKAVNS